MARNDEGLLTLVELAELMGWKNPRTAAAVRHRGLGPPFKKVGRKVIYSRAEVMEWLLNRPSFKSTAEASAATAEAAE